MTSLQPATAAGESTRVRLLDCAERMFAERGIAQTSLRAVMRAAGVNTAAIHYHFGSKTTLLDAVVERRASPMNAHRERALDDLLANGGDAGPALVDVVRAFFEGPAAYLATHSEDGAAARDDQMRIARLAANIEALPPAEVEQLLRRHFGHVLARYFDAIAALCPHLPEDELRDRFALATGLMSQLFSGSLDRDVVPNHPPRHADPRTRISTVVRFALAGLQAPSSCPLPVDEESTSCGLANRTAQESRKEESS